MADTIKIGNLDISAFKVGSDDCKVYLGDTLLYPTTPPTPSYKWLATYTGGTTSSAECDTSSAITQNEITLTDLVSVEIGDCVTSIGSYAFYSCASLTNVSISDSVTSIGTWAFYNCTGLTSIDIPNSVTSIGNNAFTNCDSITSVTIGSGVTSIGNQAFTGVVNKVVTVFPSTPPTIASNYLRPFTRNNVTIYVPSELVDTYKADANWSYYASRIQAIPNS